MIHHAVAIDTEFWGNRLEVGTQLVLERHADDRHIVAWIDALSSRCRALLMERLGISSDSRAAILMHRDGLLPYLLLDEVTKSKRMCAIVEVAQMRLCAAELDRARLGEGTGGFDRNALMWLLYERDPANVELVFLVDRTVRRGFARMVLEEHPRSHGVDVETFFQADNIQRILDGYEQEHRTLRRSHCFGSMQVNDRFRVFIKRDRRPSFVSHGAENIFGFEREWIVLDFEPNLRRVQVCSVSPDVPLTLANRIACAYFNQPVSYANEYITTDEATIRKFLQTLWCEPNSLPLVELVVRNSGLVGSPQLRFNAISNESLSPALCQFAATMGHPLERLADIESIKVYAFGKRIRLVFEPVQADGVRYVVRYSEQTLSCKGRREFERLMKTAYGIRVQSTEKKYA